MSFRMNAGTRSGCSRSTVDIAAQLADLRARRYRARMSQTCRGPSAEIIRPAAFCKPARQSDASCPTPSSDRIQFPETGPLADALFRQNGGRSLREGYVFKPHLNRRSSHGDRSGWGYWACDLHDHDRLTWSDGVYDLFGLPVGVQLDRERTVARYAAHSRSTLQRIRAFALGHGCGFVLDAEIAPQTAGLRWIRVLALPEFEDGQLVRLHGLKRAL